MPFVEYLIDNHFWPCNFAELDDLAVEFKNSRLITRSNFEALIAALEFVLPASKGHLPWSRSVLAAWAQVHTAEHTVPMCGGPAALLGAHLAAAGHGRLGAGLVLQQALGLRPSEILGVQKCDVALPEHSSFTNSSFATIGLGVRTNTKAKRAQCVLLKIPCCWLCFVG